MSRDEFPETWSVLRQGVEENVAPGFVAGLWDIRNPFQGRVACVGSRRKQPSELPLSVDTVFDLASLTKVMATAPLAALLVERGWLRWDSRVTSFFPDYRYPEIELRHLLSHTAGFAAWRPFWQSLQERFSPKALETISVDERQQAMRELVLSEVPEVPAGSRALYSDTSFLLLGFVLEEVLRMPLDQAVRDLLWKPMGLRSATYYRTTRPAAQVRLDVAATELSPWHGTILQGQVHDENCWSMGGYSGHAGAFGRVEDVLRFAGSLLSGFFTRETLQAMWTRVDQPAGCGRTLGWDTPSPTDSSSGRYFSGASVGHLGFTGTSLWIDRQAGLAVTLLSNRVHPTRDNIAIRRLRPLFHDAIRRDVDSGRKPGS